MTIPCIQCGARLDGDIHDLPLRELPRARPRRIFATDLAVVAGGRSVAAGEGSGLIDLRAMRAGLGAPLRIGGPTLGGLAPVLPTLAPPPTTRSHSTLPRRSCRCTAWWWR